MAAMNAQQYQELLVAVASMSYGIVTLWRPDVFRWPANPRHKRAFAVVGLVAGALIAVQAVLGK
jgi:uncharacterized membrane protein